MTRLLTHGRCVGWALLGCAVGCAAYAQDATPAPTATAAVDTTGLLLQLLQAGGLPAVLGAGGWLLGRGGIPITVQLSAEDRDLLRSISRRMSHALESDDRPRTAEASRSADADDSEDR